MKSGGVQVTVADVDADGKLEIVAADTHGTLAVFTAAGTELWERHVKSGIAQASSSGISPAVLRTDSPLGIDCALWSLQSQMPCRACGPC